MKAYRAPWVIPVSTPPIADGVVVVEDDTIAGVGASRDLLPQLGATPLREFPNHGLIPGLVNAHTHLALTRERDRHPQGQGLFRWLESLVPISRSTTAQDRAISTRDGLKQSFTLGTALVGEILTLPVQLDPLREDKRVAKRVFLEVLGLDPEQGRHALTTAIATLASTAPETHFRLGLSPHAPYSLHPSLWADVVGAARMHRVPWTSHIAETPQERRYVEEGTGEMERFLERLGVPQHRRTPWGTPIISALREQDLLDGLLVHGVDLTPLEMDLLSLEDTPLCLCPGSNEWLGLPSPKVRELFNRGVFLCLGTDSLASNNSLSLWAEMRRIRRLAPEIPAAEILKMATANGAIALHFSGLAGSLHPGSTSRLLAVELGREGIKDPLEYLVREPVEGHLTHLGLWADPL